jgi:hypothetical protein
MSYDESNEDILTDLKLSGRVSYINLTDVHRYTRNGGYSHVFCIRFPVTKMKTVQHTVNLERHSHAGDKSTRDPPN